MSDDQKLRQYKGVSRFTDKQGGYTVWVSSGWTRTEMADQRKGTIFSPFEDRFDTIFSVERTKIEYRVNKTDLPDIKEGFLSGIQALPDVEIEMQNEVVTDKILHVEARFSYMEDSVRRKRWVRLIYSGKSQLVAIAQGATVEEFNTALPVFFNMMNSMEFL